VLQLDHLEFSDLPQRQQNIHVAKALGLAIPDALLVRAPELIE